MNEDLDEYEADDDAIVQLLLNAMTCQLTPEEIQVIREGYTCGYVPPNRRHLYLDEDWF